MWGCRQRLARHGADTIKYFVCNISKSFILVVMAENGTAPTENGDLSGEKRLAVVQESRTEVQLSGPEVQVSRAQVQLSSRPVEQY
jgi:hypothetical protein